LHHGDEEKLVDTLSKLDRKSIEWEVGLTDGDEAGVASMRARLDGDLYAYQFEVPNDFSDENLRVVA